MGGRQLEIVQEDVISLFVAKGTTESEPVDPVCHPILSRFSVLPAISLSGVLHLAIQENSYTAADFTSFVDALLDRMNPFPGPNSVLVMDNASIHKSQQMVQMVQER